MIPGFGALASVGDLPEPDEQVHFSWCPAHDSDGPCSCEEESIEDVKADFYAKGDA